jgi:drug/metabolite transporter (DMT)-like permease
MKGTLAMFCVTWLLTASSITEPMPESDSQSSCVTSAGGGAVEAGVDAASVAPLALAIVVQVAGQGLIISGLGSTDTAVAGILVLAQPVVAAAISWSLFKEPMTTIQAAGAAAILVAVWLAQQKQRTRPLPGA